jgi:glycine amidinotransferase
MELRDMPGKETAAQAPCPVNSYNEWDPLEEVIVGSLDGAVLPPHHVSVKACIPRKLQDVLLFAEGQRYPEKLVKAAQDELHELINILETEGVVVRQPDFVDFSRIYSTPDWSSRGFCVACPRDGYLVIGDQIIEASMSWRSRYFEMLVYRRLFLEYFQKGARWVAAPKPRLLDSLYNQQYETPKEGEPLQYAINDSEMVFDAADFARCGKDIFAIKSNATNRWGIEWLRRHLGDQYRVHVLESRCPQPLHIDTTFVPLAPGKVMVNPDFIDLNRLPGILKSWEILIPPRPDTVPGDAFVDSATMCSTWISINVLMLDEKRVIVEKHQTSLIRFLRDHGFEPIPCPFLHFIPFGGAFHCATIDIRRRGSLQSYFSP